MTHEIDKLEDEQLTVVDALVQKVTDEEISTEIKIETLQALNQWLDTSNKVAKKDNNFEL